MTNLPFTPHIEGVIKTTEELCDVLYRNGADTDLFFHCFLNDLSESCSSIFKKVDVDPIDLLKESRKVLSKQRLGNSCKKRKEFQGIVFLWTTYLQKLS
jgi:hypothetical protein